MIFKPWIRRLAGWGSVLAAFAGLVLGVPVALAFVVSAVGARLPATDPLTKVSRQVNHLRGVPKMISI